METVARKYRAQAEFLFIYTGEAHADLVPFLVDTSEYGWTRADAALGMQTRYKMERRVLMDAAGKRSLQRHFGNHDDAVVIIGADARLALLQPWSNAPIIDDFMGKFLAGGGRFQESLARSMPETKVDVTEIMLRFVEIGKKKAYGNAGPVQ